MVTRVVSLLPSDSEGLSLCGGMSIVKQIIVDHDGGLSVYSNLGEGTTVTFTLPVK